MPSTGMLAFIPSKPDHQPGLGAGTAGGGHQAVDPQVHLVGLLHQFLGAGDVAERADGVGAAARDDVDLLAGGAELLALGLGLGIHVQAALAILDGAVE